MDPETYGSNDMTDMDSDYIEPPSVFRRIVGIRKSPTGTHFTLECKHVVLTTRHDHNITLGDPYACFHCSEKMLTDLMNIYDETR
jgi:hypothetical protein